MHQPLKSSSVIRIIKSRRMRWAEHKARIGEKRNVYRILVVKPEEKDLHLCGRIILKWMGWYGLD
jgi:hypothetical protein